MSYLKEKLLYQSYQKLICLVQSKKKTKNNLKIVTNDLSLVTNYHHGVQKCHLESLKTTTNGFNILQASSIQGSSRTGILEIKIAALFTDTGLPLI